MIKPIVITDDSRVNDYGFRVLTSGGNVVDYLRNPVLLYDHTRRSGENEKNIILPIGKMKDVQIMGSQIVATPDFDLEDKFAAEISRKYEKDIFNMASIGFEAIEWSTDPEYMLPGQTLPTVTKWNLKEVSITDIGSNPNCCKLSHAGRTLTLNTNMDVQDLKQFFNQPNPTMKKVIAALNASNVVKLPDTATEELVAEGLTTLSNQLSNKDQIIATKDAEIKRLGDEATAASKKGLADKATALVENALTAQKIVAAQKENFVKLAAASEDGYSAVKAMLDSMKGYTPISQQLGAGKSTTDLKAEFTKLATEGGLDTLKAENFEHFKAVYKAGTGKEFKD